MRTENPESKNPSDRQRWDLRYREGAYAQRHWPSAYLQQLHQGGVIPDDGRALDIACGRGRNSLFLASHGLAVDAVDVSPVAIAQGANTAIAGHMRVNWQCSDVLKLNCSLPLNTYALAVMIRFVAPTLLPRLLHALVPRGILVLPQACPPRGPARPPLASRREAGRHGRPEAGHRVLDAKPARRRRHAV